MEFLHGLLLRLLGHACLFDALAQVFHLGLLVLASEFLVDGLDLLVEVVLLLRLLHLTLDASLYGSVELTLVNFDFQKFDEALQTTEGGEDFEKPLLVLDRDFQLRRQGVCEVRGVCVPQGRLERVGLHLRREADVLLDELAGALHERINARPRLAGRGRAPDGRRERAVVVLDADGRGALAPLDDDLGLPVLLSLRLEYARDCSDRVNLFGRRLVNRGVVLGCEEYGSVGGERVFERAHRAGPPDLEGDLREREDDDIAYRHHRQPKDVSGRAVRIFFHKSREPS